MACSFTQKIFNIYFNLSRNESKNRFRAYCILLKSIGFTPDIDFIERILSKNTKHRQLRKNLLLDHPVRSNKIPRLVYSDIDFIFQSLLYLNTRISSSLMRSLCYNINHQELEQYLRELCYSYFDLVKSGKIQEFNKWSIPNKMNYLKNNIPSSDNERELNYGPRLTTNSEVWGCNLPFYIKSIPMGGQNKKY